MKLLVTGVDGGIAGILVAVLRARGRKVLRLDASLNRDGWLLGARALVPAFARTLHRGIRLLQPVDREGIGAATPLAALSNDLLAQTTRKSPAPSTTALQCGWCSAHLKPA
ncbi:MAG: hypothetical protein ABIQ90_06150 [Polaromonas sp.]